MTPTTAPGATDTAKMAFLVGNALAYLGLATLAVSHAQANGDGAEDLEALGRARAWIAKAEGILGGRFT